MRYALVGGRRREAEPGLSGECRGCGSAMVPKCGEHRVRHWAHRGNRHCDHWWESETEWHRAWKSRFPAEWQEIVHQAEDGEKHIADVKTRHGRVIEFQHSYLKAEERRSREAFYGSVVWVVDGLRRKRDRPSFSKTLLAGRVLRFRPLTFLLASNRCALLRDWADSQVYVFLDFGSTLEDIIRFGVPVLWCLSPKSPDGQALLTPVPVANFMEVFRKGVPLNGMDCTKYGKAAVRSVKVPAPITYWSPYGKPRRPTSFRQYMARKHRERSRRRM